MEDGEIIKKFMHHMDCHDTLTESNQQDDDYKEKFLSLLNPVQRFEKVEPRKAAPTLKARILWKK